MVQFEAKGEGFLDLLFGESEDAIGSGNFYEILLGAGGDNNKFKLFHDGSLQANEAALSWAQKLTQWKFTSYRIE